jgi:RNA polymerase sigma-70 factor (ECF subfamily)
MTVTSAQPDAVPAKSEDALLVDRVKAGDPRAFEHLVTKHSNWLFVYIFNMTLNSADTEDVLQDIWARIHIALERFRGQSEFGTWLRSIAHNMTLNFLKKRKLRTMVSLDEPNPDSEQTILDRVSSGSSPDEEAGRTDLRNRLDAALRELSSEHRAVVTMFDIQGMAHAEIANILGISEGTVRSRLFYAHRQLQGLLGDIHSSYSAK